MFLIVIKVEVYMAISTVSHLVTKQVFVMLLIIVTGYFLTKLKIITQKGTSEMSGVLVTVVTPCILIRTYHIPIDYSHVYNMLMGIGISILIHLVYFIVAYFCFIPVKDKQKSIVSRNSALLSNCGFMGIPLLQACLGDSGTFYGATYLAVFNVVTWSVVKYQFDNKNSKFSFKGLINPGIIGVLLGVMIYVTQIKLPSVVYTSVSFIADLNTPLAMLILGSFLARSGIVSSLKRPDVYSAVFFRLILAPVMLIAIMKLFKVDSILAMAMVICASCPAAAMVPIFAQKYNSDYNFATNIAVSSTIISIITIPLICYACGFIL